MAYQDEWGRRSRQQVARSGSRYPRQGQSSRGGYQQRTNTSRSRQGTLQYQAKYQVSNTRGDRGRYTSRRGQSRGVQKYTGSRAGSQAYQNRVPSRSGRFNNDNPRGRGGVRGGSRGGGRGSRSNTRGRGTGRRGGSSASTMTREQLDAEMEDYFKKDKTRGAQLLDEELDAYFSAAPSKPEEAAAAQTEDVVMDE